MTLAARRDSVSRNGIRCWLEVSEVMYAGQLLRAVLNITSDVPGVFVSLAGIRLGGRLKVAHQAERFIPRDLKESLTLTRPPEAPYGGGRLFAMASSVADSDAFKSYPILSHPHTIIPIDTVLEPSVDYSYEWIIRLPRIMAPSMQAGALFMVQYYIEVGVKVKDLPDLTFTRDMNVLPAFHGGNRQPFRLLHSDVHGSLGAAHVSTLAPRQICQDTVMDRYNRYGICPSINDFTRYPRHPLPCPVNGSRDGREEGPSDDQLYQAMANDAPPVSFVLESSSAGHVATIRLARDVLRMGEEVTCAITFAVDGCPSVVEVFQVLAEITCTEMVSLGGPETHSQSKQLTQPDPPLRHRHTIKRHEEACWLHRSVSFSLSLPAGTAAYPPSISADLGSIEWALEMILICAPHPHDSPQLTVTPVEPDKNIIQCRLPLRIVPSLAACLLK